jgi:(E)-4-hydroxy-3-methyl-but-2-enyl pyrophosphate reductase
MMDALGKDDIQEVGDYQSKNEINVQGNDEKESVVVVRAHGISPQRRRYLKSLGLPFRDGTCPDVGIIAGKVKSHSEKGYQIVIFGDPEHPEVIGLVGYANGNAHVINKEHDISNLPDLGDKVAMVSQSTMFTHEFKYLSDLLSVKYPGMLIFDTICGATKERQSDLVDLVEQGADAIVVIGGKHSANTRKLAKLASSHNRPTFHIETADDLLPSDFETFSVVGVTAGASTPEFLIRKICERLEEL